MLLVQTTGSIHRTLHIVQHCCDTVSYAITAIEWLRDAQLTTNYYRSRSTVARSRLSGCHGQRLVVTSRCCGKVHVLFNVGKRERSHFQQIYLRNTQQSATAGLVSAQERIPTSTIGYASGVYQQSSDHRSAAPPTSGSDEA